jgi:hypothetical protein
MMVLLIGMTVSSLNRGAEGMAKVRVGGDGDGGWLSAARYHMLPGHSIPVFLTPGVVMSTYGTKGCPEVLAGIATDEHVWMREYRAGRGGTYTVDERGGEAEIVSREEQEVTVVEALFRFGVDGRVKAMQRQVIRFRGD